MDRAQLIGRDDIVARLLSGHDLAMAGRGFLTMVEGEPGIGKTAVLEAFTDIAVERGTVVAWGQSWDAGVGTPYWPWIQVLRTIGTGDSPSADLARRLLHHEAEGAVAAGDRFDLFEEIVGVLRTAGQSRGLVVVLDDLHWADETSVAVLAYVAPLLRDARVMVAGARRAGEGSPTLDRLSRRADRLVLDGLHHDDVVDVVGAIAPGPLPSDVVASVVRQSAGNPLFARELTWLVASGHDPGATVPLGRSGAVADVVAGRIGSLSPACCELLVRTALLGHENDVDMLARLLPEVDVLWLLDEAVAARVVTMVDDAALKVAFRHPLFREVLTGSLAPADRAAGHLATLRGLEALVTNGASISVAVLADQAFEATVAGAREAAHDAVRYARHAAAQAAELLAYEDSVTHLRRALPLVAMLRPAEPATHAALLIELGIALDRSGDAHAARPVLLDAVVITREAGDQERLAAAAVALHRLGRATGLPRDENVRILEGAVAKTDGPDPVRAPLLAALARELHHSWDPDATERARRLATEAVELAHRSDDPNVLAFCLLAQHDTEWSIGTAQRRLPIVEAMLDLARATADAELRAEALLLRATAKLELGDPAALDDLARSCRVFEALGHARGRWSSASRRAVVALVLGRLDEAEAEGRRAAALGTAIGEPDTDGVWDTLRWELSRLRGQPVPIDRTEHWVPNASWPPHQAILRAAAGDTAGAATAMRGYSLHRDVTHGTHRHDGWVASVVAQAALLTTSESLVREVYDWLLPLAGYHLVYGGCMGYGGAIDHHLASLAAALGEVEVARTHLTAATAAHRRLGAAAWCDRDERLGERLHATAARFDGQAPSDCDDGAHAMRLAGDFWVVTFRGRSSTVRHAKGMLDLAVLLAAPGREVHALELVGGVDVGGGTGALVDDQARRAYQARIGDLQREVDEARDHGDWARAERAEVELDAIVEQLSQAFGLSGRARSTGSAAERARGAVTHRIKGAIRRLGTSDAELGRHLTNAVKTGTWCSYRPETPTSWTIDVPSHHS